MRRGDTIGRWTLACELGTGGNATVWEAVDDNQPVAIKVLNARRPTSEAYVRFRDEIHVLETLESHPGVLPLIDSHLPEQPTAQDRAWLVMPVATTARDALDGAPIQQVIEAVAQFAETLAALAARGISHRDIKPENLYAWRGGWFIGDFGLVEYPGKDPVTAPDKRLGPAHFVAPEMVANPASAAGQPADVYSLAKTLWVLLTGQRWPPPGEHRLDRAEYQLSPFVADGRVTLLEPVIARATRHQPSDRQDAAELGRQLRAWLADPSTAASPPSLAEMREEIEAYDARRFETQRAFSEIAPRLNDVVYRLKAYLDQINVELSRAMPAAGSYSNAPAVLVDGGMLGPLRHSVSFTAVRMADLDRPDLGALVFYASVAGGLSPDDRGTLGAAYLVMDNRRQETLWESVRDFEVGSADEEHAVQALAAGLAEHLGAAVLRFTEILRSRSRDNA